MWCSLDVILALSMTLSLIFFFFLFWESYHWYSGILKCLHFIAFWIMKCIGANFFCAWQFSIKFREMYFIFLYCLESQWEFQNYWFSPLWFNLYGSHIFFLPLFLISLSIIFFFSQVSWNSNTHDNSWQPEAQMKHTRDTTNIVPNPLKFTHKAHPQSRFARTNGPNHQFDVTIHSGPHLAKPYTTMVAPFAQKKKTIA